MWSSHVTVMSSSPHDLPGHTGALPADDTAVLFAEALLQGAVQRDAPGAERKNGHNQNE